MLEERKAGGKWSLELGDRARDETFGPEGVEGVARDECPNGLLMCPLELSPPILFTPGGGGGGGGSGGE